MSKILRRSLRLNWRGAVFLALTAAVGFAAASKGNNLLFVVFSTLLGVFIAAALFTILGPGRIEITRVLPDAAHAYEPFSYSIRLRSRRRLLPAFALRLDDHVKFLSCTATDKEMVKNVLLELLYSILAEMETSS